MAHIWRIWGYGCSCVSALVIGFCLLSCVGSLTRTHNCSYEEVMISMENEIIDLLRVCFLFQLATFLSWPLYLGWPRSPVGRGWKIFGGWSTRGQRTVRHRLWRIVRRWVWRKLYAGFRRWWLCLSLSDVPSSATILPDGMVFVCVRISLEC